MPQAMITNVAGANSGGTAVSGLQNTGPIIQDVVNTSTVAIPVGTLVALATPITGTTTTIFAVAAATSVATTAPLNIGVAVGGNYPGSSINKTNGTGQVVTHGHCRALVDSTTSPTVVGHRLIIGGTLAGTLSDAGTTTAAAGVNYGVVLEAVTITGSALVNIWFEKT